MLGMDNTLAIIISATVAVSYTLFGGLYSVAYTDVIQLLCVVFGLVLCIPFVWTHEAINYETLSTVDWVGKIETNEIGAYIDFYFLVILGGIPWQVSYARQRFSEFQRYNLIFFLFATGLFPARSLVQNIETGPDFVLRRVHRLPLAGIPTSHSGNFGQGCRFASTCLSSVNKEVLTCHSYILLRLEQHSARKVGRTIRIQINPANDSSISNTDGKHSNQIKPSTKNDQKVLDLID